MKEIIAYEMSYESNGVRHTDILCIPFEEKYFEHYKTIYNACFYEMRKSLEVEPYNFYSSYKQMEKKAKNTFLLLENDQIIGAVACYGNEIDDLIVNQDFQNKGYGKKLLLWGMQYIRKQNNEPITLHVAKWNEKALELYKKVGFKIAKTEKVR